MVDQQRNDHLLFQMSIICVLLARVGVMMLLRHPDWFVSLRDDWELTRPQ